MSIYSNITDDYASLISAGCSGLFQINSKITAIAVPTNNPLLTTCRTISDNPEKLSAGKNINPEPINKETVIIVVFRSSNRFENKFLIPKPINSTKVASKAAFAIGAGICAR